MVVNSTNQASCPRSTTPRSLKWRGGGVWSWNDRPCPLAELAYAWIVVRKPGNSLTGQFIGGEIVLSCLLTWSVMLCLDDYPDIAARSGASLHQF